jgi:hypothetical protein
MEDCELLCVCVSDASDRLFNEFQLAIQAAKFLGEYSTEFSLYDAQLSGGKEILIKIIQEFQDQGYLVEIRSAVYELGKIIIKW